MKRLAAAGAVAFAVVITIEACSKQEAAPPAPPAPVAAPAAPAAPATPSPAPADSASPAVAPSPAAGGDAKASGSESKTAAPAPNPAPRAPGWHEQLRQALAACEKVNPVERVICNEKAKWKYCDPDHWGSVAECPGTPRK